MKVVLTVLIIFLYSKVIPFVNGFWIGMLNKLYEVKGRSFGVQVLAVLWFLLYLVIVVSPLVLYIMYLLGYLG